MSVWHVLSQCRCKLTLWFDHESGRFIYIFFFLSKSEEKLLAVKFSKWCSVIWLQAVTNLHCLHGIGSRRVVRADLVSPFSVFWLIVKQSRACTLDSFWIKVNWKVQPESTCQRSVHRTSQGKFKTKHPEIIMRRTSVLQHLFCSVDFPLGLDYLVMRTYPSRQYNTY